MPDRAMYPRRLTRAPGPVLRRSQARRPQVVMLVDEDGNALLDGAGRALVVEETSE